MTICKFYQQGYCKFGNRCWNEHVTSTRYSNTYNQGRNESHKAASAGFSFKAALQQAQHPPQQTHPLSASGRFSFAKTFNSLQNQQPFGNQFQSQPTFSVPVVTTAEPSGFGFPSQSSQYFGQNSHFGVISTPEANTLNLTSYSDVDMNISDQASYGSPSVQPTLSVRTFEPPKSSAFVTHHVQPQQLPQSFESKKPANSDSHVYSLLDSLTPEELSAYQNNVFTFGKIPLKPPPKEVC